MPDELLPVSEVARTCAVSPKTIWRAIRAGKLRATRLGARSMYRVRRSDMEAWWSANEPRIRPSDPEPVIMNRSVRGPGTRPARPAARRLTILPDKGRR